MNQAEVLGARMVMLARRLWAAEAEVDRTQEQINALWDEIRGLSPSEVYASTGEFPDLAVVREPADPEVTMIHPRLPDDTATEQMTLIVTCPAHCRVQVPHTHLADGQVAWV